MIDAPPLAVALRLQGRSVLVVGAGPVAESKIARLLDAGALVRVVAPQGTSQIGAWAASGQIVWDRRTFQASDVEGAWLVLTATGRDRADAEVYAACEARRIWCNAADVPESASVWLLAQHQEGLLTVATGTSGKAPGLAGRLKREARQGLPEDIANLLETYANLRQRVLATWPQAQAKRTEALRWLARQPWATFRRPLQDLWTEISARIGD